MAGISPIHGIRSVLPTQPTAPAARPDNVKKPGGFGEVLKSYVDNVDARQKASAKAVQDLVAGKTEDLLPVVNEVAKADLSFKLLMGVRNKVIEAYKETMRMQI
ncbi:MAG: flagellar hook-basal body complex protein FliE [Phycisphaerae bacterium]|nr:flagellar hook-basal body complex protein FliE [Phycisphaerae bacterium]